MKKNLQTLRQLAFETELENYDFGKQECEFVAEDEMQNTSDDNWEMAIFVEFEDDTESTRVGFHVEFKPNSDEVVKAYIN